MTRFAPGNVQASSASNSRGRCCCCCSLRSGVITLGILLLIKGVLLSVQWYFFSQNYSTYVNDYWYGDDSVDSDDSVMPFNNDEGDDTMPVDNSGGRPHQGGGEDHVTMDYMSSDSDVEMMVDSVDVDYSIPDWLVIVAWVCVSWHIIGGLLGTFAGCSYSKKCAFGFWLWWVVSWLVTLAGVIMYFMYFESTFHWMCAIGVALVMALMMYFTVAAKRFYNVLRAGSNAVGYGYLDESV